MTREDLIRMAREAGFADDGVPAVKIVLIERFAALVAASEREECARICDRGAEQMLHAYKREGAGRCAAIIRARS